MAECWKRQNDIRDSRLHCQTGDGGVTIGSRKASGRGGGIVLPAMVDRSSGGNLLRPSVGEWCGWEDRGRVVLVISGK